MRLYEIKSSSSYYLWCASRIVNGTGQQNSWFAIDGDGSSIMRNFNGTCVGDEKNHGKTKQKGKRKFFGGRHCS